jgi:hypothetical protein
MRSLVVAAVLAISAATAALPVFESAPTANACSCPDCDAFRDSPVVVRGTFIGWDYVRGADGLPVEQRLDSGVYSRPGDFPIRRPVELKLRVTAVYRGTVTGELVISTDHYDRYIRAEGAPIQGFMWPGRAGVCFGLQSDPTGSDVMLALLPGDIPGTYRMAIAPFPFDDGTGRSFGERFPSLSAPRPPAVGNSPSPVTLPLASTASPLPFFLLFARGFLLLSFVLILIGPRNDHRR